MQMSVVGIHKYWRCQFARRTFIVSELVQRTCESRCKLCFWRRTQKAQHVTPGLPNWCVLPHGEPVPSQSSRAFQFARPSGEAAGNPPLAAEPPMVTKRCWPIRLQKRRCRKETVELSAAGRRRLLFSRTNRHRQALLIFLCTQVCAV